MLVSIEIICYLLKSKRKFQCLFFLLDSHYGRVLAKEWVLQHTNSRLPTENKYLVASWWMAKGFEAPAVIVVTKNLEDVCNRNYYLRAKANLVIYHIPDEQEQIPGLDPKKLDIMR